MAMSSYAYDLELAHSRGAILDAVHQFRTTAQYREFFTLSETQMLNAWKNSSIIRNAIKVMGGKLYRGKVTFPNVFAQRVIFDWLQQFENGDLWNIVGLPVESFDEVRKLERLVTIGRLEGNFIDAIALIKQIARRKGYFTVGDLCRHFGRIIERIIPRRPNEPYPHYLNHPLKKAL